MTAAVGLSTLAAQAQITTEWEGSAYVRYTSRYVFRGDKKAGQSIEANVEFKPVAYKSGFFVGGWANQPFSSKRDFEFDLYGGYRYIVPKGFAEGLMLDAGLTGFFFPQSSGNKTSYNYEFNITASYNLTKFWGVTASVYYDVRLEALTAEVSTGYRIPYNISKFMATLDFSAFFGNSSVKNMYPDANKAQLLAETGRNGKFKDSYAYYGATVSTTVYFTRNLGVSIGLQYGDTIGKAHTPLMLGGYSRIDNTGRVVTKDTSDNLYGYISVGLRW